MSTGTHQPGWYQDPVHEHLVRYWDGQAWTERTVMREPEEPPRRFLGGPPVWIPLLILLVIGIALAITQLPHLADEQTQAIQSTRYALDESGNSLGPQRAACVVRYAHRRGVSYEHLIQGDQAMTSRDRRIFTRATRACPPPRLNR